jgi:SAM-dependent methyltransferase
MKVVTDVLEHPKVYELWQAPFADRKLRPLLARNNLGEVRRVLDLGCGPGTNARLFARSGYLGVDINERYVDYARRSYGREFLAADVVTGDIPAGQGYDFILINSFLHHLDDDQTMTVLRRCRALLSDGGRVHLLELVLPASAGPARLLARWDRGKFARPVDRWAELMAGEFRVDICQPYVLDLAGMALWEMVYLRGAAA